MSTTITTTPQQPTPAANKAIYVVLGTLIAEPNYRYVADVKSAASTLLARLKCDKLPVSNSGFFNVSDIAKSMIVPAKPTLTAGWQDAAVAARYTATFMEEYGTPPLLPLESRRLPAVLFGRLTSISKRYQQQAVTSERGRPCGLYSLTGRGLTICALISTTS